MSKSTKKTKVMPRRICLPEKYWDVLYNVKEKKGIPVSRQIRIALSKVCEK